ncbi:hypothetical protein V495_06728 [Pseudogymnoascus sp. VKM F-4514 (FW-929)]|nr:hypothetical protein V495_06728 [Pseudogymnoascus sp. VKM F-4514 (FW-929)]KFY61115.1 hypothetical protein V497_03145 [Pseudogymnoascus sp. VKM F-4516 (FW-969)]
MPLAGLASGIARAIVGPVADAENRVALPLRADGVARAGSGFEHAALHEHGDDVVGDGGCVAVNQLRGWGGDSEAEDEGEGGDGELHVGWRILEGGVGLV